MMKMISWNVNGIRACVSKGFLDSMQAMDADIICLQETKVQAGQIELDEPPLTNYHQYWNYAQRKGYSGTAIFTKEEPRSVQLGLGIPNHDTEGRVITLEFDAFYLVTVYTPNAQEELASQARSIDRLEQQVNTYQMQGAQNEQSLRELQEENLRLVDENADYATQIDALNAQLSKLNSRVSTLQDSNAALQQKSAFFDAHVAFVENDGTDYYHNYSCSYFKKQSYWAYSVNLAIARGYTACPYCGG
jgi:exodeoxyribonuclease III